MDANLQFWAAEGKSFFQRFLHWVDILDPTLLLKTKKSIEDSRTLLLTSDQTIEELIQNKQVKEDWKLSLSSVHPGTGDTILGCFRSPAFLPVTAPLFFLSFAQPRGAKQAFICQFLFHTYTTAFTIAHGNVTAKAKETKISEKQLIWNAGAISYAAFMGTFPNFMLTTQRLPSPFMHTFFGKILPIPLLACLSAFNVFIARSEEYENGIQVMDKNGNVIGTSEKAGLKAVEETALSRGALLGGALLIPDSLLYFLKRTNYFVKKPHALALLRLVLTYISLGVLIPVSFSVFPQLGKIKRDELEEEILSSTEETELFYNRGI